MAKVAKNKQKTAKKKILLGIASAVTVVGIALGVWLSTTNKSRVHGDNNGPNSEQDLPSNPLDKSPSDIIGSNPTNPNSMDQNTGNQGNIGQGNQEQIGGEENTGNQDQTQPEDPEVEYTDADYRSMVLYGSALDGSVIKLNGVEAKSLKELLREGFNSNLPLDTGIQKEKMSDININFADGNVYFEGFVEGASRYFACSVNLQSIIKINTNYREILEKSNETNFSSYDFNAFMDIKNFISEAKRNELISYVLNKVALDEENVQVISVSHFNVVSGRSYTELLVIDNYGTSDTRDDTIKLIKVGAAAGGDDLSKTEVVLSSRSSNSFEILSSNTYTNESIQQNSPENAPELVG